MVVIKQTIFGREMPQLQIISHNWQTNVIITIALFILQQGILENSEDPDEMPLDSTFHQRHHCLQKKYNYYIHDRYVL